MSPIIDKQEMRHYLLGTLEAARRTELEERILCDPGVYEELLINEAELIDQYLAGGLSSLEKHQFETHFLITAERQKNLRFGRLLKRYMTSHPVLVSQENRPLADCKAGKAAPAKKSFGSYLGSLGRRPVLAYAAVLVACLGIVFLWWLTIRKSAGITYQGAPRLVVVSLAPGSMRSAGATKRVTAPPRGVDVRLELELAKPSFHNYKSQLFRESEPLETRDKLRMEAKGDQHIVPLTVTGEILSPGDYQVRLSGVLDSGADEFIDNYSFRVIE